MEEKEEKYYSKSYIDIISDFAGGVSLPASKSIGARFLVCSYLAGALEGGLRPEDCDDLRVISRALVALKEGAAGGEREIEIDVHASGTAFRFMAAVAASVAGTSVLLTGTERLCSRPMAPLLDVLVKAGAEICPEGVDGKGPYRIAGRRLKGGEFDIRGDISSQFISSLMLVSPLWEGGMRLRFSTPLVSRPYAEMTAKVMRTFGIAVSLHDDCVEVNEGVYKAPGDFKIEADWSAASFFYEACALMLSPVTIGSLVPPEESLQGDSATVKFFHRLGVVSQFKKDGVCIQRLYSLPDEIEADLSDNPDMVPAFAVACICNACRFRFTGVKNLRLKECDRLAAIKTELERLGYPINVGEDFIEWRGGCWSVGRQVVETYDDHRIAMAFAMAALHMGEVRIANPDVVNKSFPGFWGQLPKLGLNCRREGDVMVVVSPGIFDFEN